MFHETSRNFLTAAPKTSDKPTKDAVNELHRIRLRTIDNTEARVSVGYKATKVFGTAISNYEKLENPTGNCAEGNPSKAAA